LCCLGFTIAVSYIGTPKKSYIKSFQNSENRSEAADSFAHKAMCKTNKTKTEGGGISWCFKTDSSLQLLITVPFRWLFKNNMML
jgi:hypothetical protein